MNCRSIYCLLAAIAASALCACSKPGPDTAAPAAPMTSAAPTSPPAASPTAGGALYQVADGYKVDAETLKGFKTWRAAACDRCHGPNQEGMVGPSLIASLKVLSKDEFVATVTKGRLEKGMPSFETNAQVTDNIGALYAYLKGRSDGAITRSKVEPMS
jgi:mono/diheme cytochrome c family protein